MAAPHAEHVATALERLASTARTLTNPDLPQPAVGHLDIRDAGGNVIHTIELSWAVTHALLASCYLAAAGLEETSDRPPSS